jgi:hypothetical protein
MRLLLNATNSPEQTRSSDLKLGRRSTFATFCLNDLSKDDNALIQFSSEDFASEQVDEGLKQLQGDGFIATIEDVAPRRRANPRYDKLVRIKRETKAMRLTPDTAEDKRASACKMEQSSHKRSPVQEQNSLMTSKLRALAAKYRKN